MHDFVRFLLFLGGFVVSSLGVIGLSEAHEGTNNKPRAAMLQFAFGVLLVIASIWGPR